MTEQVSTTAIDFYFSDDLLLVKRLRIVEGGRRFTISKHKTTIVTRKTLNSNYLKEISLQCKTEIFQESLVINLVSTFFE